LVDVFLIQVELSIRIFVCTSIPLT